MQVSDHDQLWTAVAQLLRAQVSEAVWFSTFQDVTALDSDPSMLRVGAPNGHTRDRILSRYLPLVRDALEEIGAANRQFVVEVQVADAAEQEFVEQVPDPANHPAVVAYAMSHNATGYGEDMNPDLIDGLQDPRGTVGAEQRQARPARRGDRRAAGPQPDRLPPRVGQSGLDAPDQLLSEFAPIQELSDWFEHWATEGVKPVFTCEYGAPFTWDWTMYRGWYKGEREFGSAGVPWEFCLAEWDAQFLGDRAFRISEAEKANLRWEAKQFRAGSSGTVGLPDEVGSTASRTEDGLCPLSDGQLAGLFAPGACRQTRPGSTRRSGSCATAWTGPQEFKVDWDGCNGPVSAPITSISVTSGWTWPSSARLDPDRRRAGPAPQQPATAGLHRRQADRVHQQGPQLPPGETVEKQIIVINNSRETVTCECAGRSACPGPVGGRTKRHRADGRAGAHSPAIRAAGRRWPPGATNWPRPSRFGTGETQKDTFAIDVLPPAADPRSRTSKIALFDPKGETGRCSTAGRPVPAVDAGADLRATTS